MSLVLSINPARTSKDILTEFMQSYPNDIGPQHIRTLQRRIKNWRTAREIDSNVKKFKASDLTYDLV